MDGLIDLVNKAIERQGFELEERTRHELEDILEAWERRVAQDAKEFAIQLALTRVRLMLFPTVE